MAPSYFSNKDFGSTDALVLSLVQVLTLGQTRLGWRDLSPPIYTITS